MLLTVMILGGVMIGASAIGSLLVRYQVRQVNDALDSMQALFVADAAVEQISYCFFRDACDFEDPPPMTFESGAVSYSTQTTLTENAFTILSQGVSGQTTRILEAAFLR